MPSYLESNFKQNLILSPDKLKQYEKYQHIHNSKAPEVYDLTAAHTQEYINTNTNYNLSLYITSFKKHLDWKVLKS